MEIKSTDTLPRFPRVGEVLLEKSHESMNAYNQQLRENRRRKAKMPPEIEVLIPLIHSTCELEVFVHFWWQANRHRFAISTSEMESMLKMMLNHFQEDNQIL